jgi:hypothetical protein
LPDEEEDRDVVNQMAKVAFQVVDEDVFTYVDLDQVNGVVLRSVSLICPI